MEMTVDAQYIAYWFVATIERRVIFLVRYKVRRHAGNGIKTSCRVNWFVRLKKSRRNERGRVRKKKLSFDFLAYANNDAIINFPTKPRSRVWIDPTGPFVIFNRTSRSTKLYTRRISQIYGQIVHTTSIHYHNSLIRELLHRRIITRIVLRQRIQTRTRARRNYTFRPVVW